MLGIGQRNPDEWLSERFGSVDDAEEIDRLVAEREQARNARDFAKADQIRDTQAGCARHRARRRGGGTRWRIAAAESAVLDDEE